MIRAVRLPTCLVFVLAAAFVAAPLATVSAQPAARETLVMPFDNASAQPRLYWLGEGSAVLVSELLSALGSPVISREERLRAFERLQLPPAATLSHATVIKIAQLIRAETVVIGAYQLSGELLTVRARLIRLDTGQLQPEVVETGELTEVVSVFTRAVRALQGSPGQEPVHAGPVIASHVAFEAYVKGLIAETPATQLSYLEQAMKLAPDDRVRLAFAELLADEGRHGQALEVLAGIAPSSRWHRDGRYSAALSLLRAERYDEAFDTLRQLDAERPSAIVLNALGVVQLRRGAQPPGGRAVYYFSQATQADPTDADLFFNLGYGYWLDKDPQAAIYWLREAVRRDPADGDAHDVLGRALQSSGATAEAARERELASHLAATSASTAPDPSATGRRGGLERLRDRLEPGATRVDAVLAATGQRDQEALAVFHLDAGRRAYDREADRDAEQELRRALYLSPYLAEAHLLLGRIYLRGGRAADAVDALKIALWSEETVEAHVVLAEAYLQLKDTKAARAEIDRALALDPASETAQQLRSRLGPTGPAG